METVEIVKTANEEKTQIPKNEVNLFKKLKHLKMKILKKNIIFQI